jgi:hypothetical protein
MELKRKPRGDRIFRGSYTYHKNDTVYAEEAFEVFRDKKELAMSYFSQMHSRVATGELLTIYVDYQINKDAIPQRVYIERNMGNEWTKETYELDKKTGLLLYNFESRHGENDSEVTVASRFHVSIPATAPSMLFLKTKKEDPTNKNYYSVVQAHNHWKFEADPIARTIAIQRTNVGLENVNIDGQNLQATQYKVYEDADVDEDKNPNPPNIRVFVSKHHTIPYLVRTDDGTRIQIKNLSDLDND